MVMTLEIPDEIAEQLTAAGMDPAQIAQDAWQESAEELSVREAIAEGRAEAEAGLGIPLQEAFAQLREKHGLER